MVTRKSLSKEQMEEIINPDIPSSLQVRQEPEAVSETEVKEWQEQSSVSNQDGKADNPDMPVEIPMTEETVQTVQRRVSGRQRQLSLEEYRSTFLQVPKVEDRKPVFVSCEVRDRLDEYVRKLGSRRMSVSGLLENIVRQHLEIYSDDFERWRKL